MNRQPLFFMRVIFIGALAVSACCAQQATFDHAIHVESSTVPVVPGSIGQTLHVIVGHSLFFDAQAPLSFPCDAEGCVDLDGLCDRKRCDYLFAHTLIGKNFTMPVIRACLAA